MTNDPLALLPHLGYFSFYDTDWCVPPTGETSTWLSHIPYLYGTGLICDEGLGSLSGTVTLTDTTPTADVQVNLYRSLSSTLWQHLTTTQTTADGTYQFTDLGQGLGIDYRVQFVDSTHQLAPQYYDAKPTIAMATVITITPGVPRTGIDAVLALPQPPAVEVETESGSVTYNPDGTAQITIPRPHSSAITVTRAVTCVADIPSTVTLKLSTGPTYPMTHTSGDLFQTTIPAASLTGNATVVVAATCGVTPTETTVGYINFYYPSGVVFDKQTGQPVVGATATLYQVPGWLPKTSPDDDRPNTCESNLSKPAGTPWSQPAPTYLGVIANADVTPTYPRLSYQHTTAAGYYGWNVPQGCWYVSVEAEGYESLVSPVVGIPPAVTDLNLALTPAAPTATAQIIKSASPAITVTNGSALTYTLVISASEDITVHLYDPLDPHLTWQGFAGAAPATLSYAASAVTGTVALSATTPITITFTVLVNLPNDSFISEYAQVSNTAYHYFPGETLMLAHPSNTQVNVVQRMTRTMIYLPLVMRSL